jgi:hypothetical protein
MRRPARDHHARAQPIDELANIGSMAGAVHALLYLQTQGKPPGQGLSIFLPT